MMFDPFSDFHVAGYLRNKLGDKDPIAVKNMEHNLFRSNLDSALSYLGKCRTIGYQDFLAVHRILFADYYPWAGQDRSITMPNSAVHKADVLFSHPSDTRLAVEHGLRLGQNRTAMNTKPGEIMGLFAYGHPFLDGNGRTMLLVHIELSHRAGFAIRWDQTDKFSYLSTLSKEIASPGRGILDEYLTHFKNSSLNRHEWADLILSVNGLDGMNEEVQIYGEFSDDEVFAKHKEFERNRGYHYRQMPINGNKPTVQAESLWLMRASKPKSPAPIPSMPEPQESIAPVRIEPDEQ